MVLGSAIFKAATQTKVHEINQASLKSEQSILTSYCLWEKKERKEKKRKEKNIHSERSKRT